MATDLIDLEQYPLDDPSGARRVAAVEQARAGLRADGCAVIPDLVHPDAVTRLHAEIEASVDDAHFSTQSMNPYFRTDPDPAYPDRHPVNTFLERSSGFVAGDAWATDSAITTLFRSPDLIAFVAECLEIPELHCYADPLAGLTANILRPGQQFTWHFDTNDFAVTLLVDRAEEGGLFQYAPAIRSPQHEEFEAIQAVLEGGELLQGELGVRTLELRPGDLQIFRGRHSLHRVTRVGGSVPRYAGILAYTEQPGVIGRVDRTRQLFGRVLPAHVDAEKQRVRSDALID